MNLHLCEEMHMFFTGASWDGTRGLSGYWRSVGVLMPRWGHLTCILHST